MPLKGKSKSDEIANKATETFERLSKSFDFDKIKTKTEVISFRVPPGERDRLRILFARKGFTLAQGVKKLVYEYSEKVEKEK